MFKNALKNEFQNKNKFSKIFMIPKIFPHFSDPICPLERHVGPFKRSFFGIQKWHVGAYFSPFSENFGGFWWILPQCFDF